MFDWLQHNEVFIGWLILGSGITFILSLMIVPAIIIYLPVDYFCHDKVRSALWSNTHPLIKSLLILVKNTIGLILIFAGIIMLVLPGQGILTILAGMVLMDFPGKYQLERWIVERGIVLRAINWIRSKAGKDELIVTGKYNATL